MRRTSAPMTSLRVPQSGVPICCAASGSSAGRKYSFRNSAVSALAHTITSWPLYSSPRATGRRPMMIFSLGMLSTLMPS